MILLRIKSCREGRNTHFMFNNSFPKMMTFMRLSGKIWYRGTDNIIRRMCFVFRIIKARIQTHKCTICY